VTQVPNDAKRARAAYRKLVVSLTGADRAEIETLLHNESTPTLMAQRARMLQLLDAGEGPPAIGRAVVATPDTVRAVGWRYREGGLEAALYGRPRKRA
jgi:hypothetical protein